MQSPPFAATRFGFVNGFMSLTDMPGPGAALREAACVLSVTTRPASPGPGGVWVSTGRDWTTSRYVLTAEVARRLDCTPMADAADFVTIRADHLRGRAAVVASHRGIFSTIYAGSRNRLALDCCRLPREDVALMHARSVLEVPTGPLVGRHEALFSTVLLRDEGAWTIGSFHITLAPSR